MRLGSIFAVGMIVAGLTIATAVTAEADVCVPHKTFMVPGYPAAGGILPWENGGYDANVARDTTQLVGDVNTYAANCSGPIHVEGHSYGARVAGDALLTLDSGPHAHRITGLVTGDPRHVGGIEDSFEGVSIAGITMTGARPHTERIPVTSHCNTEPGHRDGICSLPRDPEAFIDGVKGYFQGAHTYDLNPH